MSTKPEAEEIEIDVDFYHRELAYEYRKKGVCHAIACPVGLALYQRFGTVWIVGPADAVDTEGRYIEFGPDVRRRIAYMDDGKYFDLHPFKLQVQRRELSEI